MLRSLRNLAGRVWWYPHDEDPRNVQGGVEVIADDAGSVLVDADNSPTVAREIRAAIEAAGLPAPRRLVYTRHRGVRIGRWARWRS